MGNFIRGREPAYHMSSRAAFVSGARDGSPLLLGLVPFGLVAGVTAVGAGLDPFQAAAMSVFIFAGASQLAAIELIGRNAPALVVVVTVLVVNLRMMMYSASIAPYFRHLSRRWKWPLAYLLTDQAYALSLREFTENEATERRWYYLGVAVTLWAFWQVATVVGIVVGAQVPESWGLEFAVPLTFMALLVPVLKDRATEAAALVGGVVAVAAAGLPFNLGLITAALLGVLGGLIVEGRTR